MDIKMKLTGTLITVAMSILCLSCQNGPEQDASGDTSRESLMSQESSDYADVTGETETDEPSYSTENSACQPQELVGQNNHFTVSYGGDLFYRGYGGIYKVDSNGEEELFYPVEDYGYTLYQCDGRLYYCGHDLKIHSIGIDDKDETVVCDGVVTCDFYGDYLFTFTPQDSEGRRDYVGYKIDTETGKLLDGEARSISEIGKNGELSNVLMSDFSDIHYQTDEGLLKVQTIAVMNPLISSEKLGGYYFYNFADDGHVSLEYQDNDVQERAVLWKKLFVPVLLDDLKPTWTALPVDSGIFFTELAEHAECVFPIYYADQEGNIKTILEQPQDLVLGRLLNFDGQWLYYRAYQNRVGLPSHGYYRVHVDTSENQCLYTTEYDFSFDPKYGVDIQGGQLFYNDPINEEIVRMDLDI